MKLPQRREGSRCHSLVLTINRPDRRRERRGKRKNKGEWLKRGKEGEAIPSMSLLLGATKRRMKKPLVTKRKNSSQRGDLDLGEEGARKTEKKRGPGIIPSFPFSGKKVKAQTNKEGGGRKGKAAPSALFPWPLAGGETGPKSGQGKRKGKTDDGFVFFLRTEGETQRTLDGIGRKRGRGSRGHPSFMVTVRDLGKGTGSVRRGQEGGKKERE